MTIAQQQAVASRSGEATSEAIEASKETVDKVENFRQLDEEFKRNWDLFERGHEKEITYLDALRERRNAALDDAVRHLRAYAQNVDYSQGRRISAGPFVAQKRWQEFYSVQRFIAISQKLGIYEALIAEGVIIIDVRIDDKKAKGWIEAHQLQKDFAEAEDGRELTTAILGPKTVPGFGIEFKDK